MFSRHTPGPKCGFVISTATQHDYISSPLQGSPCAPHSSPVTAADAGVRAGRLRQRSPTGCHSADTNNKHEGNSLYSGQFWGKAEESSMDVSFKLVMLKCSSPVEWQNGTKLDPMDRKRLDPWWFYMFLTLLDYHQGLKIRKLSRLQFDHWQ